MSRGKKVFFSGLALLGLGSFLAYANPAEAAMTVSSAPAAGVDNIAPGPVSAVAVEADLGAVTVTISWGLAAADFVRQAPVGSDLTSGGVFSNVNDVAGYNVWRRPVGGENELVSNVGAGSVSYVDDTVQAGLTYIYSVTALDRSGNESGVVESDQINLGPPPSGGKPVVPPGSIISKAAQVKLDAELPPADAQALFIADMRAALAELLGISIDRIKINGISAGSIIIDFEIEDDATSTVSADDAVASLETQLTENPDAFVGVEGAGTVLEVVSFQANLSSIDLGAVGADEIAFETLSFTNTATDAEAVLSVTASASGDGYSVSPATLSLAAGETGSIDVEFDAAAVGNLNGSYAGTVTVLTNDPNQRETIVSVSASIEAGLSLAGIAVSGAVPANFGSVFIGADRSLAINVANTGDLTLSGTLAIEGDAAFTEATGSFSVEGGQSVAVSVTFTPTAAGAASGTLVITSNDADQPEVRVALSGSGSDPGDVQVLVAEDGSQIFGDFDGSTEVNFDDFFIFADNFGVTPPANAATDLDANGEVNFDDFFIFADNFGKSGTYVGAGG